MCALCGALGTSRHWTDAPPEPGLSARELEATQRRRERMRRVAAADRVLRHYHMTLADWQGSAFMLSTFTGKTEMVENLSHLWAAAERLIGRRCDPLDDALLASLDPSLE
jgi:hypothetical protein